MTQLNKTPEQLEKQRIRIKKWQEENKEQRASTIKLYRDNLRLEVLNHYSGNSIQCKCCGETEIKFMSLDHINNDGAEHRRKIFNGNNVGNIYGWVKRNNYPDIFQVLCHNCNLAKGFYGECPHKN